MKKKNLVVGEEYKIAVRVPGYTSYNFPNSGYRPGVPAVTVIDRMVLEDLTDVPGCVLMSKMVWGWDRDMRLTGKKGVYRKKLIRINVNQIKERVNPDGEQQVCSFQD